MKSPVLPGILKQYEDRIIKTYKEFIDIKTHPVSYELAPIQSKFGGKPLLLDRNAYPTNSEGRKLIFLAQINFEAVPKLTDFPESGILQMFISDGDLWGLDFHDRTKQENFRVLYISKEQYANKEPIQDFDWPTPQEDFVLDNEFSLTFERDVAPVPYVDFRYDNEINYDKAFDDFYSELVETYFKFSDSEGHKIGGYPNFTQDDPRGNNKYKDYSTLLFQMDSEYYPKQNIPEIMWGDVGVANFFIKPENLQKRDFSDVIYTWDCS